MEHKKLQHQELESTEETTGHLTESHGTVRPLEFSSPEELLRFDANQTTVPGSLDKRVERSVQSTAAPESPSLWRRLTS